jgi:hypothetical protein
MEQPLSKRSGRFAQPTAGPRRKSRRGPAVQSAQACPSVVTGLSVLLQTGVFGGLGNPADRQRVDRLHRLAAADGHLLGISFFRPPAFRTLVSNSSAHDILLKKTCLVRHRSREG